MARFKKETLMGNFLEVQWLGLRASTAGGTVQAKKKKKKKKKKETLKC